jgi:hypothetical protein
MTKQTKLNNIKRIANNALYFGSTREYLNALWDILEETWMTEEQMSDLKFIDKPLDTQHDKNN